ncbi:MAG: T9SS type A sorting domain-containing protein [Bacteroidetes bacterium]|nr:T9SS type A sorting domain-containing protein [Bacteroidota bacterium]MBL6942744.1 T9SS type A sorting domain-containing protein [Bacteroidales bacterium]
MKSKIILTIFLFAATTLFAQDTLTVMHYNLLNYGNYTDYCTTINNNINEKDEYIRTIIDYVKPDIFTVNEISPSLAIQQRLLDNDLNINGITHYKKANFIKVAESDIVNMLYYNSHKLQLHSHMIIQSYIRDIDLYKLYYRSEDLPAGDTAFVICVVAHLKSSTGVDNEDKRLFMVNNAMDYLNSYSDNNNYLFMGDFNVYSSNEPGYQLLTNYFNPTLNFYDPINTPGNWNNNYSYRFVHTQSTHASSSGCASTGGMDDRFDFILISDKIKQGSEYVEYIDGSYTAIGQDGLHFNKSINDTPTNLSAPSNVIETLYGNSDHLPVLIKLRVDKTLGIPDHLHSLFTEIIFNNPVAEDFELTIWAKTNTDVKIEIWNISGVLVFSDEKKIVRGQNRLNYNLRWLNTGIYIAVFTDGENSRIVKKVVKK